MNNLKPKQQYAEVCNEYYRVFCDMMEMHPEPYPWVADEPGTIACASDYYFDFHDVIKYCVDENINDWNELLQWYDYTLWAADMGFTIPNFRSWHRGCPRVPAEKQQELNEMKRKLNEEIKAIKEKY